MSWKVFVSRKIPEAGINLLEQAGMDVRIHAEPDILLYDRLVQEIGDIDAMISLLSDKIDAELLAHAPDLKIIANYAVGYNNIDLAACSQRNICVTNTPDVLTDATADLTFTLMLSVAKRIAEGDRMVRSGQFAGWGPMLLLGGDITGKTLGIIGAGRIGTAVARRAAGFNMKILYYDLGPNPELEKNGAEFTPLENLISQSDFVTLHVPLNESTFHLLNEQRLAMMKPTAYLINTSRGPVVDEKALVEALRQKVIAGAGLDVFEEEPRLADGLADLPNTVLLPHIASATVDTRTRMSIMAAENIIQRANGEVPQNLVNTDIL